MAVEPKYPEYVSIRYTERVDGDGDLFDWEGGVSEAPNQEEELCLLTDDLYAALQQVLEGTREAPFSIEVKEGFYVITPKNRRLGLPFRLPTDPAQLETVTSGWRADVEGQTCKRAIYDALFAAPTSEE